MVEFKNQFAVYVVDDDSVMQQFIVDVLKTVGIDAVTFSSASDFLDCQLPDLPSCLLLDNRMPEMSGLELQRVLQKRGSTMPVIFISGHGDVPTTVRAMKAGAHDFLVKPFSEQDLIEAVHGALRRSEDERGEAAKITEVLDRVTQLTEREREVFAYVVKGYANKGIAGALSLSEKTVKVHRARAMEKMGAESLAELVRMAVQVGIDGPEDLPGLPPRRED